jgi:RNA polymerase sigma-70 factor (ECF subfamily)
VQGYFCGDTALASDATQEIFIKVWEKLDTLRNDRVSALGFTELQKHLPSLFKKIIYERNQDRYSASGCCRNLFERKDEQLRQMYQCIQKLKKRTR